MNSGSPKDIGSPPSERSFKRHQGDVDKHTVDMPHFASPVMGDERCANTHLSHLYKKNRDL